jgi:hypothetical protein
MPSPSSAIRVQVEVICPASDRQVSRYRRGDWAMIQETPQMYEQATKLHIQQVVGDGSSLAW